MEKREKRVDKTTACASKRANNSKMEASKNVGKTTRTKSTNMESSSRLGKTSHSKTNCSTKNKTTKACN